MRDLLLFFCIVFPVLAGCVTFFDKGNALQRKLVNGTGIIIACSAVLLFYFTPSVVTADSSLASLMKWPIVGLDFLLLGVMVFIGVQRKHSLIILLGLVQFVGMLFLELGHDSHIKDTAVAFNIDSLALVLVLVVSLVGPLIARYGLGYMKEHEAHLMHEGKLEVTARPRFFALVLIFLGAMNGLVLADNLTWLYFFWEITTLCSYLLISHDGTKEANANACRALWMNMAGGVAFVCALLYLQQAAGSLSLIELAAIKADGNVRPIVILIPVIMLCFAGFTKSAQMPFQSWLCGAMVAPTPVSALLHSSTMVKAGVYLIIRLAPLYADSSVSSVVAIFGGFTFLVTAALAAGQSNGKKILAYSTISNLGLIIACAGINTPAAIGAALMLIIFHAVSKGMLFLCVGAIEQKIGSRDIEDMRGLFQKMPRTALLTSVGIFTMMLPPFGMLLAKWMAIESSVEASAMPFLVSMLALGSALTVLYWARWAGCLLATSKPTLTLARENRDPDIKKPLHTLCGMALVFSFLAPLVYVALVYPAVTALRGPELAYAATEFGIGNATGLFMVYPIFIIIAIGLRYAWKTAKDNVTDSVLPYMCGEQATNEEQVCGFTGPLKGFVPAEASNYYLHQFFGEDKITRTANTVALVLLAMLFGGVL
jgi:NADH:ubiquinone oxidoreductase subunit 5 (chain L)/Multisubunit Na+/H+ antiporter, MnhA subunit